MEGKYAEKAKDGAEKALSAASDARMFALCAQTRAQPEANAEVQQALAMLSKAQNTLCDAIDALGSAVHLLD